SAAGLGLLLKNFAILRLSTGGAGQIAAKRASAYTEGSAALCKTPFCWGAGGLPTGGPAFDKTRGLWARPPSLFLLGRSQARMQDYAGALATSEQLHSVEGAILRRHFAGVAVVGWITEAECCSQLSRFEDASRLYKQVLDHWGQHAASYTVVREV